MPITVPHEFVAVSMAQGYAMITGEPQVVMVHVIVGTGNASAAVMNASRLNVPMIFSRGAHAADGRRTARQSIQLHSLGPGIFRSGQLAARVHALGLRAAQRRSKVETVVDRALEMALGNPQGPVYLTLPREVLAQKMDSITIHPFRKNQAEALQPSARNRSNAQRRYCAAPSNPLIVTGRLGSDPTAVSAMVSFAEALA